MGGLLPGDAAERIVLACRGDCVSVAVVTLSGGTLGYWREYCRRFQWWEWSLRTVTCLDSRRALTRRGYDGIKRVIEGLRNRKSGSHHGETFYCRGEVSGSCIDRYAS
jgi:hypothetical protein